MIRLIRFFFIITLLFACNSLFAQKAKTHVLTTDEAKLVKKDAATLFASSDYRGALTAYLDLYKTDPKNTEYNYRLGYCYLQTTIDRQAALPYLEFAMQSKDAKKEWSFFLGLAYMYNNKWDEASKAFSDFKSSNSKPVKDFLNADRMIEMCANGKRISAKPVNCTFNNLGKIINTTYEEYNPFISANGKTLVFTSRRKGNVGGFIEDLGIYTADMYWSTWKDTAWSKPKSFGGLVNSEWDEESVGLSALGDQVMVYFDNVEAFADIGVTSLKGKMWQKPAMLAQQVNSKQFEGGACMSLDGSQIFLSSDRKEGVGGSDIWTIKKDAGGEWGAAQNLGKQINTSYDEESPYLSLDGKTLYFASKGWDSMGGYDIFSSQWNEKENKWEKPVNLGYPINNADDNYYFSLTGDGTSAYTYASRHGGIGDFDIYRIDFPDTSHHPFRHIVTGKVTGGSGKIELTKVYLENDATKTKTEYKPSTVTSEFVLPAEPGEYTLHVEGYNFHPYTEKLIVDNEFPPKEITRAIQVQSGK